MVGLPREPSFRPPLGVTRPPKPRKTTQEPTSGGSCVVVGCLEAFSAFESGCSELVQNGPNWGVYCYTTVTDHDMGGYH